MSKVLPYENMAVIYEAADPQMLLRIIDGDRGPGLVSLDTLRQISAAVELELADRIGALETGTVTRADFGAEVQARVEAMQALSDALAAEISGQGQAVAAEAQARAEAIATLAARVKALEDKPSLRIARFAGTTNGQGVATITFSPAFTAAPDVDVIEGWSGEQMVSGAVVPGSLSATGCQVQVMVSRGNVVLSSGPFTKAGSGISVTARAIGR